MSKMFKKKNHMTPLLVFPSIWLTYYEKVFLWEIVLDYGVIWTKSSL
jgi:hypothetical protein